MSGKQLPIVTLAALAMTAVVLLGVSAIQGSDDLPTCGQLQEVVVSLDRPEGREARLCKDPVTGMKVWEVLEGEIIDEGDHPPPTRTPTQGLE